MNAPTINAKPFTPFQIEMLELVSRVSSEVEMQDIRRLLGQYFAKRAEEKVMEEWKNEHMRTPYKQ